MPQYSADQIIGKTLIAKTAVPIKRTPFDSSPVVYTVSPGQPVGVVSSWVSPTADRATLYWQFMDANDRPYYAAHMEGRYDIKGLQAQGTKTTAELEAEKARANESFGDTIQRYAKYILWGAGGLIALNIVLSTHPWKK